MEKMDWLSFFGYSFVYAVKSKKIYTLKKCRLKIYSLEGYVKLRKDYNEITGHLSKTIALCFYDLNVLSFSEDWKKLQ